MLPNDLLPRLSEIAIYAPIGIIGAWRWSVWLFQKIVGLRYRPISPSLPHSTAFLATHPKLSVVTPVYNEDPAHFLAALDSWQSNGVNEIIAVIDASDTACIETFQTFSQKHPSTKLIITDEPGKRPALVRGVRHTACEYIALVDSDTLWDDDIRDILLTPFANERVGGVGCRQEVINPQTVAEKLFSIRLTLRYLHEYLYLASISDALTCLSGRTAVYRRTALLPVLDELKNETFLWKPCISGDDKRLTSLVMRDGWKLRYQSIASVRTYPIATLKQFFKQNLRWSRNSWRTDLRMIGSAWTWRREPFFLYHLIDRSIQPFTLLLGPIYFLAAVYFQHFLAATFLFIWWFVSRTVKLLPHLREVPEDIRILPVYIFAQFYLAVLKIFALLTLDFQSWITRWDVSRMKHEALSLVPSRFATGALIGCAMFFVFQNTRVAAQAMEIRLAKAFIPYTEDFSPLRIDDQEVDFWTERRAHEYANYLTRPRETPRSILRKFNIPPEKIFTLFPNKSPDFPLPEGTDVRIPITDLLHSLTPEITSASGSAPIITYRPTENMIHVKGGGSVISLTSIVAALPPHQEHLVEIAPRKWLLRSKLYISEGVTLILDGAEVSHLQIASSPEGFAYIRSQHGGILIKDTSITSWDETRNAPDTDISDGRAFIVAYGSGRMDVLNADIGYLGFSLAVAKRYQDFGGNYGLSWKLQNGTFGRYTMAGNVLNSTIHHNYFGLYTYGTSGMLIQNNEFSDNLEYGIDPHDDSNNLLIEDNFVHNNGNHGIIGSKRVRYSTIRHNRSINNRLHGIMLDKESNFNLVAGNTVFGNINGIALADSHSNLIRNNSLTENRFGIRGSISSSKNSFNGNIIQDNERGVFLYGGAEKNVIRDNDISGNGEGVYLKDATQNAVIGSLRAGSNTKDIQLNATAQYTNFIQRIQ